MKTTTLYRPVGEKEMVLILESNFKKFPPRLEWQPIFYPVLDESYASEIAEKWNTRDEAGNYLGFVTQLQINILPRMSEQEIIMSCGCRQKKLDKFNQAIIGSIEVTNVFIGNDFRKSENTEIENLILKLKNET
ncbi:ADP-ribosylation/crystallin J1 [Chryseobacterium sp. 09-1422]|uniref:ADP-ribosylation/crystallin J1 n=1 Tax=Chryseobacterium kimseyorum TaxID=2984028 RepID=A0ABT3HVP2_9FLAO|nr:ADP-ribosylation/crystallin J1 [Chryseobacterium kimseyorum]MCW3167844.1 ADP-ribosylation/crystallin J1 [Chryseobacterium kimseyorum]